MSNNKDRYRTQLGQTPGVNNHPGEHKPLATSSTRTALKGLTNSTKNFFPKKEDVALLNERSHTNKATKMKIPSHKRGLEAPTLAPEPQRKILKKTHGTPISSKALENSSDYSVIFEVVYTDGSSRGNGKVGARAGVGVFFGDGDPRNVSEPLAGSKQTNQRAELTAALKAIRLSNPNKPLEIRTDSQYLIKGVTSWIKGWVKKNWITSTGKEVLNRDLFESLDKEIKRRKLIIKWTHVSAHSGIYGNEMADQLAVQGASKT